MNLEDIIKQTKTYYCLECGKCSSLCPISKYDPSFSPRVMVEDALLGLERELVYNKKLFSCLACYNCQPKCPSDVDFPLFVRESRRIAAAEGQHGDLAHSGSIHALTRIMARSPMKQNRLGWLERDGLKTSAKSDTLLFVGCAPYFEPLFEDIPSQPLNIAEAAVKVLNTLGIEPMVNPAEKCCGHDALWMGDIDTFERLKEHNAAMIKESGVKKIVFTCPECYRTLKLDYPDLNCELLHISELIAQKIESGELKLNEVKAKVTYQDPCRLGRHLGVYDAPRKILAAIPGVELTEMEHNKSDAICCGTSCFVNCDSYSKHMRVDRLLEAKATGAETLVTACPKCQTHFRCAMLNKGEVEGPDVEMEVTDLLNLVAKAIGG